MKHTVDVSVIIVNFNTRELTCNCLKSIFTHTHDVTFEVIVSDNGSTDGSIEAIKNEFPQVTVIENNENLGFGTANNRGLSIARGKYIFYLNSDTILLNNAVKIFFNYWETAPDKESIGALGANLLNAQKEYIHSAGKLYGEFSSAKELIANLFHLVLHMSKTTVAHFVFRRPLKKVVKTNTAVKHIGKVGFITGADLFIKNNSFAKFDEHYFMYYEETDLEYQLSKQGLYCMLIDGPEIIHLEGGSDSKIVYEILDLATFSKIHFFLSRIYFYKKNKLANAFQLTLIKLLTLSVWVNPLILNKTKPYIRKMLSI